jgi:hypothetical protein
MNQEASDTKKYPVQEEVIHTGARTPAVFSLVPKDLTEAMKLAELIANSDLAPKDFKGKTGNVLIAVQMGAEVGLSPMAAIQSIAVINGKPSLYGDVGKAILLSNGFVIEEWDTEKIKQAGYARCRITRPGHPPCERTFSIEDARTAGLWEKSGPWSTYPERQMAWRAFWFAARDIGSDVLKGLSGAEEVADLPPKDITPMDGEYKTGTQRLRDFVVKPSLDDVKKAFADAMTPEEILAAQDLAKRLESDEDKQAANAAYKARIAELKKPSEPAVIDGESGKVVEEKPKAKSKGATPELTFAQIADKLNKATDQDNLDAAADLIQYCVGGADQVEDLNKLFKRRRDEFREGGTA